MPQHVSQSSNDPKIIAPNFGQKSSKIVVKNRKFWSKIENIGQKSKIFANNQYLWPKIKIYEKKSKIW